MKIGINLLYLIPGKVGGTEIFARNIVRELSLQDKSNKYILYLNLENKSLFNKLPSNFKISLCPIYASNRFSRIIWEQIVLPIQCLFDRVDILHSLGYTAPLVTHCKKITTIYDLNYHFFPEDFNQLHLIVFRILMPLIARTSDVITVHSNKSKQELAAVYKIPKKKIQVAYGGVSDIFRKKYSLKEAADCIKRYKIKKPFILSAATTHPHKNLKSLVLAYSDLIKKHHIKRNLVLIGFPGRGQNELNTIIRDNNLTKRVIFTGWVDPKDTPLFFKSCDLFVFPSLYEGFGLPLVEAMATGVPLVASNASCIPEIVGNGGAVVDCRNVRKLSDTMHRVIVDKKYSKMLAERGRLRSKRFNWKDLAVFNLKLYEKTKQN